MAKVDKKSESGSVENFFLQLISQHNKISPGASTIGSDMSASVKTYIDSGSLLLNLILSNKPDGGWPCGRTVEVFGKESIGKSTLAYVAMARCQRAGGIVIYCDIERSGDPKFMQMLGVDLSKIVITNEETIEKLFQALEDNLSSIINSGLFKDKPVFIAVDSVTALQTDAELEGGYDYNMNVALGKAKQLGKAIKKITPFLSRANACLYMVNQIRDNTTGYGQSWTVPGGKALPFYASIRVYLEGKEKIVAKDPIIENEYKEALEVWKKSGGNKSGLIKPEKPKTDDPTIGYKVTAYTIKNKIAPPDRRAHFNIIFSQGLSDIECYLDYCLKYGLVKKAGAWYEIVGFVNDIGKFYSSSWLDIISDVEIYNKVERFLIEKLVIPLNIRASDFIIENEPISNEEKELIASLKKEQEE